MNLKLVSILLAVLACILLGVFVFGPRLGLAESSTSLLMFGYLAVLMLATLCSVFGAERVKPDRKTQRKNLWNMTLCALVIFVAMPCLMWLGGHKVESGFWRVELVALLIFLVVMWMLPEIEI